MKTLGLMAVGNPTPLPLYSLSLSLCLLSSPRVWSRRNGSGFWVWKPRAAAVLVCPGPSPCSTAPSSPCPSLLLDGLSPQRTLSPPFASGLTFHCFPTPSCSSCLGVGVCLVCVSLCVLSFFFPLGFPWRPFPLSRPREVNWNPGPPLRCGPHLASRGCFYSWGGDAVEILPLGLVRRT